LGLTGSLPLAKKNLKERLTNIWPIDLQHSKYVRCATACWNCKNLATIQRFVNVVDHEGNILDLHPTQLEVFHE